MKIVTWNVNGIRAVARKGFLSWLTAEAPDILCLQETKAWPEQLRPALVSPPGYHSYWAKAERKGYSGLVTYVKTTPQAVEIGFNRPEYDAEGRVMRLTYPDFTLLNIYVPNGRRDLSRLDYKLAFYDDFLHYCNTLQDAGHKLIICGDFNTAHQEIDLANPAANRQTSGFRPEERAWIDRYLAAGYEDIFRRFNQAGGQYTWWTYRLDARARNIGWRLDYFLVAGELSIRDCYIMPEVMGSDHCPVALALA